MERNIYVAYLFLIPCYSLFNISMPFFYLSTLIALLGFALGYKNMFYNRTYEKWVGIVSILIFYNIFAATIGHTHWGIVHGETTFDCIFGNCILYGCFLISILYNMYGLSFLINQNDLIKILKIQSICLLIIGYIQLCILYGILGPLTTIYDFIADLSCLQNSTYLLKVNRGVTLFGSEPSSISAMMLVSVPFSILYEFKKSKKIMTISWLILLILTGSSQAMASFALMIICIFFLWYRRKIPKFLYFCSFGLGLFMALFYTFTSNISHLKIENKFATILYGKAFNLNDYSVQMRESTVINDMKVFFEFPITGVGDGIQGVLYNKNIPDWVKRNKEVWDSMDGKNGILNGGGNFFPAFLSGYGIIGLIMLLIFLRKYRIDVSEMENDFIFKNIFSIGIILFLLLGWQTVSIINNEFMPFLLSLPYMSKNNVSV